MFELTATTATELATSLRFSRKLTTKLVDIAVNYPRITWEIEDAINIKGLKDRTLATMIRDIFGC